MSLIGRHSMVDMLRCVKSSSRALSTGPKSFLCKIKLISHHTRYSDIFDSSWIVNTSWFLVSSVNEKSTCNFYYWLYYSHASVKNKTKLLNQLTDWKMKCFITEKYKFITESHTLYEETKLHVQGLNQLRT